MSLPVTKTSLSSSSKSLASLAPKKKLSLASADISTLSNSSKTFSLDDIKNLSEDDAVNPISRRKFEYPSNKDYVDAQNIEGDMPLIIDDALRFGIQMGASDIFIKPNSPVWYKVNGKAFPVKDFQWLSAEDFYTASMNLILPTLEAVFTQELELDTSYTIQDPPFNGARFRLNFSRSDGNGICLVFRYINPRIETPETLHVPQPVIDWTESNSSLYLITGITGSGKSTTLASLIRKIQLEKPYHIITIENPIETIYPRDGLSVVTQREINQDTLSFTNALTSAMRQAPNCILIGEIRTKEEINAALEASLTGHLTFSTTHTLCAESTMNRLMAPFKDAEKMDVLERLSTSLKGIMAQQLLQRKDGTGRVAVHEVLQVNEDIQEYISKNNLVAIRDYMYDRKITMNHQLLKLVKDGTITFSEGITHSTNPHEFNNLAHAPGLSDIINYNE